jgi:hypothetical protein
VVRREVRRGSSVERISSGGGTASGEKRVEVREVRRRVWCAR